MAAGKELPKIEVTSRAELRAWLLDHHATSGSIWLVTWKKTHPHLYIGYDAIVEEALCFGWVDSLPRKLDEDRSMLLLSRRKVGSAWSAVNKARVDKLSAAGLMHPFGTAAVDAAKSDGSWLALDDVERLEIPPDLNAELATYPNADRHFAAFPRSVKRSILEWINLAKRPETRQSGLVRPPDWPMRTSGPTRLGNH